MLVALSELTDVTEGGVAHTILGVVATELAQAEQRMFAVYKAFGFGGSGTDLDDRCGELPGFQGRLGPSSASGTVMSFTRLSGTGALFTPAGLRIASDVDPNIEYITTQDFIFEDGQTQYPDLGIPGQGYVRVACLTIGSTGNAPVNTIRVIVSTPNEDIVSCTNAVALTNGLDRESDESLRKRAFDYFASLCQVTKDALEYLAKSFQSSDGTRALHAFCVRDPNYPGMASLVVDDGEGFQGSTRPATPTTGTVPANGQRLFYFESPVSIDREPTVTIRDEGGDVVGTYPPLLPEWVLIHEAGEAYLEPDSQLMSSDMAGYTWTVDGYNVYTGFISELQRIIEGWETLTGRTPGWRGSGCRVRVQAPTPQAVDFEGVIVVSAGYDFNEVRERTVQAIIAFLRTIPPGQPLIMFRLYQALRTVDGLENARFSKPVYDQYAQTNLNKLFARPENIDLEG